ncbi:MAG: triose-phosphate isomerase [candidate division WOR-3 bacterium]
MRRKIIAGNWKMYLTHSEAVSMIREFKELMRGVKTDYEIVICPPFTSLYFVGEELKGTEFKLGAQNLFYESEGAYTGEISPKMLTALGCSYVIIGHSERRKYFYETDDVILKKVKAAIEAGLTPILCVGENLEDRNKGIEKDVVRKQFEAVFGGLGGKDFDKIVIAYEPVWAIGTGVNATPEQAQEMHGFLRDLFKEMFGSDNVTIIYGGSVKPDNIHALTSMPDVDGALVGGASIKAKSFFEIIMNASKEGN